ncbi:hypothetical protein M5D96_007686 [Drosophila gunungcola]|uniref:Uncharacterized protein n=1 Tax=Drosophila gunungcola TaxID=103775 RepID=A0A9Q0BP41_9MUSC|nr:hypothetical protein M5D96_007686 [Drosophila gunungcola]
MIVNPGRQLINSSFRSLSNSSQNRSGSLSTAISARLHCTSSSETDSRVTSRPRKVEPLEMSTLSDSS